MSGIIEEANKTAAGIRFELENSDGVEVANLIQIASFNREANLRARAIEPRAIERRKQIKKWKAEEEKEKSESI